MQPKKELIPLYRHPYFSLLLCLLLALALLIFTRVLMLVFNPDLFRGYSTQEHLIVLIHGLRFDVSALMFINALFIVFMLLRSFLRLPVLAARIGFIIFYILPNSVSLLLNLSDVIYYRFTLKRTTADILDYLGYAGDLDVLLPQFLHDFWFIFVIGAICIVLLIVIGWRIQNYNYLPANKLSKLVLRLSVALLILGFMLLGMRGGFSLKPIGIAQASNYGPSHISALVLNTPFSVIKTFGKSHLNIVSYFDDESLMKSYFNAAYAPPYSSSVPFEFQVENPNFVIILLESFSKEHIGALSKGMFEKDYKGFTPFLDSLIEHSLIFEGYANGKKSIEAIPAIISGLPSLMNNDYISSVYANNTILSLAEILRKKAYQTHFFHGGSNGTMGFDTYSKGAGFQNYYGRDEFNDETYYDGRWGIYDEEFLQFTATKQSITQQPFFSFIFTLSSHHPYTVPAKYIGKFQEGRLPIHKTIAYTDYALQQYFKTASQQAWFSNTVFIITSDHTSEACTQYFQSSAGMYSIPVIFYMPGTNLHLMSNNIVQHTDLLPTILHLINHQDSILAFGSSAFDTSKPRFNITYRNGIYQLIKDGYIIHFDGNKALDLYDVELDSLCQHNILDKQAELSEAIINLIKSLVQQYNHRMVHNELTKVNH